MRGRHRALAAAFFMALSGDVAFASSGDAWAEFAAEVQSKCSAAAREHVELPRAIVDPFGTERFGVALVTGKPKGANGFVSYFCVYDKRRKTAELGSELDTRKIDPLPEE